MLQAVGRHRSSLKNFVSFLRNNIFRNTSARMFLHFTEFYEWKSFEEKRCLHLKRATMLQYVIA